MTYTSLKDTRMEDSAAITVSHLGVQYVCTGIAGCEFCSPTRTPNRHWSQRRWQKYFDEGNAGRRH